MEPRERSAILLLVFALAATTPCAARGETARLFEFGAKGGLAMPSFFWTGDSGWNAATMFAFQAEAYLYVCVNLTPSLGVQIEAGYHGKGCSVDAADGHAHWYMDYVELPVWARWSARETDAFSIYGGIGGYVAWFLGGRYDFSTGASGLDGSGSLARGTENDPTVVRPLDYGILFVAGVEFGAVLFELRFSVGVVPSMDFTPPSQFGGTRGTLNSGLDALVGYRL
jgi:hypothetical protein